MNLTYLKEVLEAREARAEKQCGLLCGGGVLISFSLNIPGPVKNAALYRCVFETGLAEIRKALSEFAERTVKEEIGENAAGPYAFFLIPEAETVTETAAEITAKTAEAAAAEQTANGKTSGLVREIKRKMIGAEEASPLGRLYDIDVLYRSTAAAAIEAEAVGNAASAEFAEAAGKAEKARETCCPVKVSRTELGFPARGCLVCGKPAFVCVRAARHRVPEVLMSVIDRILSSEEIRERLFPNGQLSRCETDCRKGNEPDRDAYAYAESVSVEALRAILYEVTVTPKPGLVDTENNGAHRDMNITTFFDSAVSLTPYFKACVLEGIRRAGEPETELLPRLRPLGLKAEESMYRATGGINTHKGAVFTLGLFCAAAGILYAREEVFSLTEMIPVLAGRIASSMENGSRGVRAEAMNGYPSLRKAMEKTRAAVCEGPEKDAAALNAASVRLLLELMCRMDDSNAVRRAGEDAGEKLRERTETVLRGSEDAAALLRNAAELDRELMEENISPGGAADLLSAGLFLQFLENLHKKKEI